MLSKLRAVGAVVLAFSLACAGADALEVRGQAEAEGEAEPNQAGASSARASDGVAGAGEAAVLGNGDTPDITEGSNTNWRPLDPEPGRTPPLSGSEPVVKPSRKGAAGTTPVPGNAAPTNTASTSPSSGTNTATSSASSPSPVAP